MPRTRSLAWSELKIGVLAVVALVMAAVLIFAVGGETGLFTPVYRLTTRFPNVEGLKPGAVVRVAGVEVGTVEDVAFEGAEVRLTLRVQRRMQSRITSQSRATIGALSLLGEAIVEVSPSSSGTPLKDGEEIVAAPQPTRLTDVAASANRSLEQAAQVFEDVRAGKGTVGRLFTDEALYKEITAFVSAAGNLSDGLRKGEGTLGQLLKNPKAYRNLETALAQVEILTRRVNAGEGSLGRLLNDEAFARSLTSATENLDKLAARINAGEGTAGRLVTDDRLYERLSSSAERLERMAARLEDGQGTFGQLLQDQQLYENMNAAVRDLQGLLADIRKDPKKYLQVRVSIF